MFVAISSAENRPQVRWKLDTWFDIFLDFFKKSCSTSSPGGNQVDDLPPAAHTGAGSFIAAIQPEHCPNILHVLALVLLTILYVLHKTLWNQRHIYKDHFLNVSLNSITLTRVIPVRIVFAQRPIGKHEWPEHLWSISALDRCARMSSREYGSKNLLQRGILYRHKRYY